MKIKNNSAQPGLPATAGGVPTAARWRQRLDASMRPTSGAGMLAQRRGAIYQRLRSPAIEPPSPAHPSAAPATLGTPAGPSPTDSTAFAARAGAGWEAPACQPTVGRGPQLRRSPGVAGRGETATTHLVAQLAALLALGLATLCAVTAHLGAVLACGWTLAARRSPSAQPRDAVDDDERSFVSAHSSLSSEATWHSCSDVEADTPGSALAEAWQALAAANDLHQTDHEAIETLVAAFIAADAAGQAALAHRLGQMLSPAAGTQAMLEARVEFWAAMTVGGGRREHRDMLKSLAVGRYARLLPKSWMDGGLTPALARLRGLEAAFAYASAAPAADADSTQTGWQRSLAKVNMLAAALGQSDAKELSAAQNFAYCPAALADHGELKLLGALVARGEVSASAQQLAAAKDRLGERMLRSIKLALLSGDTQGWQMDLSQLAAADMGDFIAEKVLPLIERHADPLDGAGRDELGKNLFGAVAWWPLRSMVVG